MSGRFSVSSLLLLLFFHEIADGFFWGLKHRKVSITGRLGCINTTGQWIPMPEAEVFLFEDDEFADPHDLLAKTVTDKDGRFAIAGEEKERWDYPRFFLGFYAYCNGKKYGNWTGGPCADQEFIDECDTYARYRTTHSFEKGGDGSEKPGASQLYRDRYRLDCTLGFAGGGTMPGLSCGGSMCWHGGSWRPKPKIRESEEIVEKIERSLVKRGL
ncbi:hypothetical protein PRIPAC_85578 [Pristionchus pacificus]|uniref:Uncharacterized protein n=1 Tax=Pristionchus pacificus TaxID=54126 RepID=A0A2A6BT23_PRIPA|nr:hypothetical protein PRIPAC_85578 [Pristionchus pacificus]|eukprot:PDM69038.1 hypothetical protein PRIPAC_47340 [Pristionchus pacificus]